MIEEQTILKTELPSMKRILKATLLAFGVALVILVTAILPAEYGVDPVGTGAAMGLLSLSKAEARPDGAVPVPEQSGTITPQSRIYKVDSEDFLLTPGQGVEMKYHMAKGAVMVYSWKADTKLQYEFHGEPDQKPNKDYYESYELEDKVGKDESHGSFTAPTTGIHGWFWQNKTDKRVTFHLVVAGFFDGAKMYSGGTPEDMPVEDAKQNVSPLDARRDCGQHQRHYRKSRNNPVDSIQEFKIQTSMHPQNPEVRGACW